MNRFLSELGSHLEQVMVFPRVAAATETWGNAEAMTQALARVRSYFDGPYVSGAKDGRSVAEAVLRFRRSRQLNDSRETKYVCIGASQEFSGWRILEDAELLEQLLRQAGSGSDLSVSGISLVCCAATGRFPGTTVKPLRRRALVG